MALISKIDKQIWDSYVSNLERTVIVPSKKDIKHLNRNITNTVDYKQVSPISNFRFIKKKVTKPDFIIDLHGYSLHSGKLILNKSIVDCYEKNIRNLLIITGKGFNNKGALKKEVPKWLNDRLLKKYLVNFNQAPKKFGGEGALLVRIKNKYKNY